MWSKCAVCTRTRTRMNRLRSPCATPAHASRCGRAIIATSIPCAAHWTSSPCRSALTARAWSTKSPSTSGARRPFEKIVDAALLDELEAKARIQALRRIVRFDMQGEGRAAFARQLHQLAHQYGADALSALCLDERNIHQSDRVDERAQIYAPDRHAVPFDHKEFSARVMSPVMFALQRELAIGERALPRLAPIDRRKLLCAHLGIQAAQEWHVLVALTAQRDVAN